MGDAQYGRIAAEIASEDAETTPLLSTASVPPPPTAIADRDGWRYRPPVIVAILCTFVTFLEFGNFVALPAENQIFEDLICRQFYTSLNGTGVDCKSEPVQSELGLVIGWMNSLEGVPGIALAVPFGMLADSWGRRPVMLLAVFNVLLVQSSVRVICNFSDVFPLRAVWYVQAFNFMGGGGITVNSMAFTIVADTYSAIERTSIFFILAGSVLVSEVFGAPLGAALAEKFDPWIPFLSGPLIMLVGVLLTLLLPETLPPKSKQYDSVEDNDLSNYGTLLRQRLSAFISTSRTTLPTLPRSMIKHRALIALVLLCFVGGLAPQTTNFIILYASKRFGWTLARAAYLYSLRSAINVAQLLVVLPGLAHLLVTRLHFSGPHKDLVLSRLQLFVCLPGCFIIGFAHAPPLFIFGIVVFSLGSFSHLSGRSLALSLVGPAHYAAVNGACSVFQGLGIIIGGPVLAAAWHRGLVLDGLGLGLPFFVAGALFGVAGLLLATVRIDFYNKNQVEEVEEVEEDDSRI